VRHYDHAGMAIACAETAIVCAETGSAGEAAGSASHDGGAAAGSANHDGAAAGSASRGDEAGICVHIHSTAQQSMSQPGRPEQIGQPQT
jgi:hypothetical protein